MARRGGTLGRFAVLVAAAVLSLPGAATARRPHQPAVRHPAPPPHGPGGFDRSDQRLVVGLGLLRPARSGLDWAAPLSFAEAQTAFTVFAQLLAKQGVPAVGVEPLREGIELVNFDALAVDALGLSGAANHVEQVARERGLQPPWYFGTEVVARALGLRFMQPRGYEQFDLYPNEPITRAEAAFTFARALSLGLGTIEAVKQEFERFALPRFTAAQLAPLRIAVSLIGYPYVWGGTTSGTEDGLAHGGFDCSGFVWRVFKLSGLAAGRLIHGRTAAEQAAEAKPRIPRRHLAPADLLFFGSHFHGKVPATSIEHEGIYLGDGWVIHSSAEGVYIESLEGSWLGATFAFGRRVVGR